MNSVGGPHEQCIIIIGRNLIEAEPSVGTGVCFHRPRSRSHLAQRVHQGVCRQVIHLSIPGQSTQFPARRGVCFTPRIGHPEGPASLSTKPGGAHGLRFWKLSWAWLQAFFGPSRPGSVMFKINSSRLSSA